MDASPGSVNIETITILGRVRDRMDQVRQGADVWGRARGRRVICQAVQRVEFLGGWAIHGEAPQGARPMLHRSSSKTHMRARRYILEGFFNDSERSAIRLPERRNSSDLLQKLAGKH